jgi:histidinol phosphatase-like PHP family hydrolase
VAAAVPAAAARAARAARAAGRRGEPHRDASPSNDSARDTNALIVDALRDLASVQPSPQRRWGYKRAAAAIRNLDAPIERYLEPDGSLRRIPHIGPASTRIILEVLDSGTSATASRAIADAGRTRDIEQSRAWREHFLTRARVVATLAADIPGVVSRHDYRGDLQMHSTYSDGSQTVDEIAGHARRAGYEYAAITDHSYGLPIAGGVSMERLAEQHRAIEGINEEDPNGPRLLKGIEANILADGRVDMESHELRLLDLVVAAPHSVLRTTRDQTSRMMTAVATPGVHIIGHPRGRMYGSRPGVAANWREVFLAAADRQVAVEIDGDPSRQDLDYTVAAEALECGCLFALDSDAHGSADWTFVDTALAHARLARIPPDRIVNCWPLPRLLAWLDAHRR